MSGSFYNTTNQLSLELKESHAKAESQEEFILAYFKKYPDSLFSPCDVWSVLYKNTGSNTPLTSCRRAITNLQLNGELIKTHQHKTGVFGKKTYMWKLKSDTEKQMDIIIKSI